METTPAKSEVQLLNESLGFLVNALARLMMTELDGRLHESGLTPTTWSVMMALGEEDGLAQTELSRRIFFDGATVTRALDILEARSLIKRERDEFDRRIQKVTLTPKGRDAYPIFARLGLIVNNEATRSLSESEQELFKKYVRLAIDSFNKNNNTLRK